MYHAMSTILIDLYWPTAQQQKYYTEQYNSVFTMWLNKTNMWQDSPDPTFLLFLYSFTQPTSCEYIPLGSVYLSLTASLL